MHMFGKSKLGKSGCHMAGVTFALRDVVAQYSSGCLSHFPPVLLHFSSSVLLPSRLFSCQAVKVKGAFGETLATVRGLIFPWTTTLRQAQTCGPVPAGDSKEGSIMGQWEKAGFHWSALTSSFLHHLGKRLVQKRRTGSIRVAAGSSSEACHSNES